MDLLRPTDEESLKNFKASIGESEENEKRAFVFNLRKIVLGAMLVMWYVSILTYVNEVWHMYSVDRNFFNVDSPEVFYVAGIVAADGCIHQKRKIKNRRWSTISYTFIKRRR